MDNLSQMVLDTFSGQYIRLIASNKIPDSELILCPIRWFKYAGFGYRCVDGGSGNDSIHCFKAYDVSAKVNKG